MWVNKIYVFTCSVKAFNSYKTEKACYYKYSDDNKKTVYLNYHVIETELKFRPEYMYSVLIPKTINKVTSSTNFECLFFPSHPCETFPNNFFNTIFIHWDKFSLYKNYL